MKIIKNPWNDILLELVTNSHKNIKITSPFIKNEICESVLKHKLNEVKINLITSFKIANVYNKSIDISALEKIISDKGKVKTFPNLHAKVYIFDDKKAVVTSANFTNGGIFNNYEYGILVEDKKIVNEIVNDYNIIFHNEITGTIKTSDLTKVQKILDTIPKKNELILPHYEIKSEKIESNEIFVNENETIQNNLKGWNREVFLCLNKFPNKEFNLADINKFEKELNTIYPTNNTIPDKIRQTLQNLRNIGLIEFLGRGNYKKLWI